MEVAKSGQCLDLTPLAPLGLQNWNIVHQGAYDKGAAELTGIPYVGN